MENCGGAVSKLRSGMTRREAVKGQRGRFILNSISRRSACLLAGLILSIAPQRAHAIAFGEVTNERPTIARIALPNGGGGETYATAVFIAPQWLLTAAHTVTAMPGNAFVQSVFGNFDITASLTHPQFTPGELYLGYDVGLIRIDTPLPDGIVYPVLADSDVGDLLGIETLFLGFGLTESGDDTGDKRQATATIQFSFPETFGFYSDILLSEPYVRPGDSGGPAFGTFASQEAIIGVASYSMFLGELAGSAFTLLAPARSFIDEVVDGVRWTRERTVVSEPAGLTLVGLAMLALLRRRGLRHQG